MSGLYNVIFGRQPDAAGMLAANDIDIADVPRFRDVWLERTEDGQVRMCVHTRTGGGNREYYDGENSVLQAHDRYLFDEDDDYDSTYANFYFQLSDEFCEAVKAAHGDAWREQVQPVVNMGDRWQAAIDAIRGS